MFIECYYFGWIEVFGCDPPLTQFEQCFSQYCIYFRLESVVEIVLSTLLDSGYQVRFVIIIDFKIYFNLGVAFHFQMGINFDNKIIVILNLNV